ncbi:MAG TPA: hypothetical protein ENK49_10535 [Gammaproteobacteria bacterium]|nr:hypothetical protein [Gammaproteobacteria bacterium]
MRALDRSTIIGYGKLVWDKTGKETAANRGHPPDGREYSDDICANGYNLGCGGQVVLEIVGRNGEVQNLREGQSLIVQTRQKDNCGEEFSDKLTAFVCSDPAAAGQGDLSSCTWEMPLTPLGRNLYGPDRVGGTITSFRPE